MAEDWFLIAAAVAGCIAYLLAVDALIGAAIRFRAQWRMR